MRATRPRYSGPSTQLLPMPAIQCIVPACSIVLALLPPTLKHTKLPIQQAAQHACSIALPCPHHPPCAARLFHCPAMSSPPTLRSTPVPLPCHSLTTHVPPSASPPVPLLRTSQYVTFLLEKKGSRRRSAMTLQGGSEGQV